MCCATYNGGTSGSSTCQAACAAGSYQLCSGNDCPAGQTCNPLLGGLVSVCGAPPDAGSATDAGSDDAGTGTVDAAHD